MIRPTLFSCLLGILVSHALAKEPVNQHLNTLFESYLGIQTALSQDSLPLAKQYGEKILAQKQLPETLVTGITSSALLDQVKKMNQQEAIGLYRESFMTVSQTMIALFSKATYSGDQGVYVYFCPMANNNQGADWLQGKKGTANPYFGSSMFACGGLKKEIKSASAK